MPGTTTADPLFTEAELRDIWSLSMTNACQHGCSTDLYDLQPIAVENAAELAKDRKIGSALSPYYLISKRNPDSCGSAGCQSAIIAISGEGVIKLQEEHGLTLDSAHQLSLAKLEVQVASDEASQRTESSQLAQSSVSSEKLTINADGSGKLCGELIADPNVVADPKFRWQESALKLLAVDDDRIRYREFIRDRRWHGLACMDFAKLDDIEIKDTMLALEPSREGKSRIGVFRAMGRPDFASLAADTGLNTDQLERRFGSALPSSDADPQELSVAPPEFWATIEIVLPGSIETASAIELGVLEIEPRVEARKAIYELPLTFLMTKVEQLRDFSLSITFAAPDDRNLSATSRLSPAAACKLDPTHTCAIGMAMEYAHAIDDPGERAGAMTGVAEAQVAVGDFAGARGTIVSALEVVREIQSPTRRAGALSGIATVQAAADEMSGAQTTFALAIEEAQKIDNPGSRALRLSMIAEAKTRAGGPFTRSAEITFSHSLEAANEIVDARRRAWSLATIAKAQIKAGDLDGSRLTLLKAGQTAEDIEDAAVQHRQLIEIAVLQTKIGQSATALKTIKKGRPWFNEEKIVALAEIALTKAHLNDLAGARALIASANAILDGNGRSLWRVPALLKTAQAQAAVGNLSDAQAKISSALADVSHFGADMLHPPIMTMSMVVETHLKIDDIAGALQTTRTIQDEFIRNQSLLMIVEKQVEMTDFRGAHRTAQTIPATSHGLRDLALSTVAAAQIENGEISGAQETLRAIQDSYWRDETLIKIVSAQLEASELSGAIITAQSLERLVARSLWMAAVAKELAWSGENESDVAKGETHLRVFPLLSQKDPASYRDANFRLLQDSSLSGPRPVWQLACLATVYTMIERGLGRHDAMIDDWYEDPRQHGGDGPGARRPSYVSASQALEIDEVSTALDANRPTILQATGGPLGQHFVLVVGIDGEGDNRKFIALDPWPGQATLANAPGRRIHIPITEPTPMHPLIANLQFTQMRMVGEQ